MAHITIVLGINSKGFYRRLPQASNLQRTAVKALVSWLPSTTSGPATGNQAIYRWTGLEWEKVKVSIWNGTDWALV